MVDADSKYEGYGCKRRGVREAKQTPNLRAEICKERKHNYQRNYRGV